MILEVLPLKFAVLGGDDRSAILSTMLRQDGHNVSTYCLEKSGISPDIPAASCLHSAVYGAE